MNGYCDIIENIIESNFEIKSNRRNINERVIIINVDYVNGDII